MAEALAAVGVASSLVELATFTLKVLDRLNDFRETSKQVPSSLKEASVQLALLEDILATLQKSKEYAQSERLKNLIIECGQELSKLDAIIAKLPPTDNDSTWRRTKKAFVSVRKDRDIREILQKLQRFVSLLSLYCTTQLEAAEKKSERTVQEPLLIIPFEQDEQFIGRESILKQIESRFEAHKKAVLVGMGGVGKSQVAIEFCYRFKAKHSKCHILWVHAETSERITEAFNTIAEKACLSKGNDPGSDKVALVSDWLSGSAIHPWLLVLDNADNEDILFSPVLSPRHDGSTKRRVIDYLPQHPDGRILITTRDARVGSIVLNQAPAIQIGPFSREEALDFLKSKLGDIEPQDSFVECCNSLDYIPLALSQAAAYIHNTSITMQKYLGMLKLGRKDSGKLLSKEVLDLRRDRESLNSIEGTLAITFKRLRGFEPRAAEILQLMSCFNRQGVPDELLQQPDENIIDYEEALGRLRAFSLIFAQQSQGSYQMHRLVQHATRRWMQAEDTRQVWESEALQKLVNVYPRERYAISQQRKLEPHVQAVCEYDFTGKDPELLMSELLQLSQQYSSNVYDSQTLTVRAIKALDLRKRYYGEDDKGTLVLMHNLAVAYFDNKELAEAEDTLIETIKLMKLAPIQDDERLAHTQTMLVLVLIRQDKIEQAAEEQAKIQEPQELTGDSDGMLSVVSNINAGIVYHRIGNSEEALRRFNKAHATAMRTLDFNNGYRNWPLLNLLSIYREKGEYRKPQELLKEAIAACTGESVEEQIWREDNQIHLVRVYQDQGNHSLALELAGKAATKMLESENSIIQVDYIKSRARLAQSFYELGCREKAVATMQNVVDVYQRTSGPNDESTIAANADLLRLKAKIANLEEVEALSSPTKALNLNLRSPPIGAIESAEKETSSLEGPEAEVRSQN